MKTAEEILKSKLDGKITFVNNPDYTFNKVIEAMEEYRLQSHPSPMSAEQYDLQKLYDWVMDENRKPSITAFTSSIARNIAFEFEFRLSKHKSAMSAEQVGLGYYYPLFKFFADEHGLTLLDSQMQDVIHECKKFIEPATTGENWKTEYDNCRALLQELVSLKVMRENLYKGNPDGKEYAERKPKAWQAAQQFLSTYQHEGLSTTPSVKADGWVSVEDGLPEKNGDYLVTDGFASMVLCFKDGKFNNYNGGIKWWEVDEITHWQTLPAPPKQQL